MLCDLLAMWSADLWDAAERLVDSLLRAALLLVLMAFWSPADVEAYREEWAAEVRGG